MLRHSHLFKEGVESTITIYQKYHANHPPWESIGKFTLHWPTPFVHELCGFSNLRVLHTLYTKCDWVRIYGKAHHFILLLPRSKPKTEIYMQIKELYIMTIIHFTYNSRLYKLFVNCDTVGADVFWIIFLFVWILSVL